MEVQAADKPVTASPGSANDIVQWILQMWLLSVLCAFAAGAMCWRQWCSRRRQREAWMGELGTWKEEAGPIKDNSISQQGALFHSPPSSRIRKNRSPVSSRSRRTAKGANNQQSSKDSSSVSTSKSSRRRKACNKQPPVPEESMTMEGIRGRPSAVEKGRTVLNIMENRANRMMQSPGQPRES